MKAQYSFLDTKNDDQRRDLNSQNNEESNTTQEAAV